MPKLFPAYRVAALEPLVRTAVEDGETASTTTEFGGRHWQGWTVLLCDAGGEIFAGLSFTQDITEQVTREQCLEELVDQLEESNECLEQFVYAASHDLKSYRLEYGYTTEIIFPNIPNSPTTNPDTLEIDVHEVSGMAATPEVTTAMLTARQREAVEATLALGYYEISRKANYEDITAATDCASSTAAEHLRKAERKLVRSTFAAASR